MLQCNHAFKRYLALSIVAIAASCSPNQKEKLFQDSPTADSSWYSVKFRALCGNKQKTEVPFSKVAKYDTYNPYDTVVTTKTDSVLVSFDFIADCCLTFSGRAQVLRDTLILTYGLDKYYDEACSCYCDYRLSYRIHAKELSWSQIKIKHRRMAFKDDVDE